MGLHMLENTEYAELTPRCPILSIPTRPKRPKKSRPAQIYRLYDDWSVQRLMNRASVVGIQGWQHMTREQLIEALRRG